MRGREEYLMTKRWTRLVMAATGLDPMDAEKIVKELPARTLKEPLCPPVHDSEGVKLRSQNLVAERVPEVACALLVMFAAGAFNA